MIFSICKGIHKTSELQTDFCRKGKIFDNHWTVWSKPYLPEVVADLGLVFIYHNACRSETKEILCVPFSLKEYYRKTSKNSDTRKNYSNNPKIWLIWIFHRVMRPTDADGIANSVDPDQTAPLGAIWSGSTLFAQTHLSENLGSLWVIF